MGFVFSEHVDGAITPAKHGLERHCVEAAGSPVSLRPVQGVGEGQEPRKPGRPTDRGWEVGKGMSAFGQAVGAIVRAFDPFRSSTTNLRCDAVERMNKAREVCCTVSPFGE